MWTDHQWETHRMTNGRLQCIRDQMEGEMFNSYPKGSEEWKGYQDEMNHRIFIEDHLSRRSA